MVDHAGCHVLAPLLDELQSQGLILGALTCHNAKK